MNVLINATAAKYGGAKTIVNAYLKSHECDECFFYILSPEQPPTLPKNSIWIQKETNGFYTTLFAGFLVLFYARKYNCGRIVSFSNVNLVFSKITCVTYFHNLLILTSPSFKYLMIRYFIKILNRNSEFVFQTSYVKDKFKETIFENDNQKVLWPGVDIEHKFDLDIDSFVNGFGGEPFFVIPITDVNLKHKNFALSLSIIKKYSNVNFVVTSNDVSNYDYLDNVFFLGSLSRDKYLTLVSLSEGVVITSTFETTCLPIFEALQLNCPAFVFNRNYVRGLMDSFSTIEGLFTFNEVDEFSDFISITNRKNCYNRDVYRNGGWDF